MIPDTDIDKWLFDLFLRREVLDEFETQLRELAGMCENNDEFKLVSHIVEHLVILNSSQLAKHIMAMANHIKNTIDDGTPLAVVAMSWDEGPDSSQLLVQMLKRHFKEEKHIKLFNSVPQYTSKKRMADYPRFVLVDDFSGTGSTIKNRYNHLLKHAKSNELTVDPYVCLLFGMEEAVTHVKSFAENSHFCASLAAGISGHFNGDELDSKIKSMQRLETMLAPSIDDTLLPSFGHGRAEALFVIKDHNAPNSNFPVLWWPMDVKNKKRLTIMERAEL